MPSVMVTEALIEPSSALPSVQAMGFRKGFGASLRPPVRVYSCPAFCRVEMNPFLTMLGPHWVTMDISRPVCFLTFAEAVL